jgi:hypothetical protein
MKRYLKAGSPAWMASAALIRCASSQSRCFIGTLRHLGERLDGEPKHPAGHRDGHTVTGKVEDQRVHHFGLTSRLR